MDPEDQGNSHSLAADEESHTEPAPVASSERGSEAAWALIEELAAAGEWPPPDLAQRILDAGDAATEPLIAILQGDTPGITDHVTVWFAIGLLSMSRPAAAIPALVEVVKNYDEDNAEDAANALSEFGARGFDALVELCQDPSATGYVPYFCTTAAIAAAGDDPVRRSRIAEFLREQLEAKIAVARIRLKLDGKLVKHSPGDLDGDPEEEGAIDDLDEDFDDEPLVDGTDLEDDDGILDEFDESDDDLIDAMDDEEDEPRVEPEIAEAIAFIVSDLATLADALALGLIYTAYQEGLVDEEVTSKEYVDKLYQGTVDTTSHEPEPDWLEYYKQIYTGHIEKQNQIGRGQPRITKDGDSEEDSWDDETAVDDEKSDWAPVTAPIVNTGPKLGRNDPCWCGSGKKYKKCHLNQREPM